MSSQPEPDPVERARHIAELAFIESAVQAAGYRTESIEPADAAQVPEIVVTLDDDEESRQRSLRISFIPVGDSVEATTFLQLWVPLPFSASAEVVDDVRRAATIVNEHVALGRFGVGADGSVSFRYVLAARKHTMIDDDLIAEIVAFVDFHQEHFGVFMEGICDGGIAVDVLENVILAAG